jgi:hypothetical protein
VGASAPYNQSGWVKITPPKAYWRTGVFCARFYPAESDDTEEMHAHHTVPVPNHP